METDSKIEKHTTTDTADGNFLDGFLPEAAYAQIRKTSVRTCQRDRLLRKSPPYIKFGRRVFYRVEAVREWLVKREHQVPASRHVARINSAGHGTRKLFVNT
jgi:hypothetical protein